MRLEIACPRCGLQVMTAEDIASAVFLREDLALISLVCPRCDLRLAVMSGIPPYLRGLASEAFRSLGIDTEHLMPLMSSVPETQIWQGPEQPFHPGRSLSPEGLPPETIQTYLDYFHHELEGTRSVDDAIAEIDGYLPHDD
jgi:hypothetical protein